MSERAPQSKTRLAQALFILLLARPVVLPAQTAADSATSLLQYITPITLVGGIPADRMARYGDGPVPFVEDQPLNPVDPYGIAKYAAELLVKNVCETHGIEYVIAVPHNIIGPKQKYDDPYRNVASIMGSWCCRCRIPLWRRLVEVEEPRGDCGAVPSLRLQLRRA